MPSWAWVVTEQFVRKNRIIKFQCPHGLELLPDFFTAISILANVSMPSWAWVVTRPKFRGTHFHYSFNALMGLSCYTIPTWVNPKSKGFQCPHGLELLQFFPNDQLPDSGFNALMGLSCYVSNQFVYEPGRSFNALMGLSCYYRHIIWFAP